MNAAAVLFALSSYICFATCTNANADCISKCCSENFILSFENQSCIAAAETGGVLHENVCPVQFGGCPDEKVLVQVHGGHFDISQNGSLVYNLVEPPVLFARDEFCVEYLDVHRNVTALVCVDLPEAPTRDHTAVGENCTPKCCPRGSSLVEDSLTCLRAEKAPEFPFEDVCPVQGYSCRDKVPFVLSKSRFSVENSLLKYSSQDKSGYFSKSDFCVEHGESQSLVAVACFEPPERSESGGCVTKCCPHMSALNDTTKSCVEINQTLRLPYGNTCRVPRKKCKDNKRPGGIPERVFKIQKNYSLVYSLNNFTQLFERDDYCVEYKDDLKSILALVCVEPLPYDFGEKMTSTGMIISMPFLLATFIAYALLPDRNLHMKALMFYVINLMISYLLLCIIQLSETRFSDGVCTSLGYFCLYFFLVSFFWMNVICIDIWFGFSGLRGFSGSKKEAERKRFFIYCGYAWGVPTVHVLIVYLIHLNSGVKSIFNPGIGDGQCFLSRGYPELFYFYGPMGILISINIIFFATTACRIRKIKRDTSMLKKEDSKRHSYENDKQTFNLYLKLLFAMGINWSMEIISWAVIWAEKAPEAIWYLTDFCNAIYGVFIFFIFVFKKSIWKLLKKRYYSLIGKPHLAHSIMMTNTTRATSYSTANSSVHDNPHAGATDNSTLTSEA